MNLGDYLGNGSEDETPRNGPLSARSEWHAAALGTAVGTVVALVGGTDAAWLFLVLAGIALGVRETEVKHLRHVQTEPVYALSCAVGSYLVTALGLVPRLPNGV